MPRLLLSTLFPDASVAEMASDNEKAGCYLGMQVQLQEKKLFEQTGRKPVSQLSVLGLQLKESHLQSQVPAEAVTRPLLAPAPIDPRATDGICPGSLMFNSFRMKVGGGR